MNYDTKIESLDSGHAAALPVDGYNPLVGSEEDERRSRRRIWIVAIVAILVMAGLWFALHGRSGDEDLTASRDAQAPVVTVITPGRATVTGRISATGSLAARREEPVGVAGEGGQVQRVLVEAGDWVRQGQVLAVIDRAVQVQQQAGQAAQIQAARADARLAQSNLDRALKLVERGFVSRADVDRLTATRDAARARVGLAEAQLSELRARTSRLNIVAPSAGLVLERNVEPGQVVSPGSGVLFRLAKGGEMELLARLTEENLSSLAVGTGAMVTPVGTTKQFTGQVWQISPVIDEQTRQGTARIALAYSPELRPGGFATAEIQSGTLVAPKLPESAVLSDGKGSYVYIVNADNKVERRDVKTGLISDDGIIVDEGLNGSERIVQRAGAFLSPGETVKAKMAQPAT